MTPSWERSIRRIAIGSDHAGFELKEALKRHLRSKGIEAVDVGTHSTEAADYPDYAEKVAELVSDRKIVEGILVCGTGIGMSVAANKYPRVRAAVAVNPFMAKTSRSHNDANVLCLGSRISDETAAIEIVDAFLEEAFQGGRHARRLEKIAQLDRGIVPPARTAKESA